MLRKILMFALVLILVISFGCKKKESAPSSSTTISDLQKQAETATAEAAKEAEAAKQKAGEELEQAGKELQK